MEILDACREGSLCPGGREAQGEAHAGPSALQVPAEEEEEGREDFNVGVRIGGVDQVGNVVVGTVVEVGDRSELAVVVLPLHERPARLKVEPRVENPGRDGRDAGAVPQRAGSGFV